jgi:hypothetical protein
VVRRQQCLPAVRLAAVSALGLEALQARVTEYRAGQDTAPAYPGGIVDRVVKLTNGDYEVHNIGVNWPHHTFVNKTFKVVGAD